MARLLVQVRVLQGVMIPVWAGRCRRASSICRDDEWTHSLVAVHQCDVTIPTRILSNPEDSPAFVCAVQKAVASAWDKFDPPATTHGCMAI